MNARSTGKTLRFLVAPDSFKGSVSAKQAASAIARGILRAAPGAAIDPCPLADGGEGTLDVLVEAKGGAEHVTRVTGPLGSAVDARWGSLPDGLAVVEAAEAAGLELVPRPERNPALTTSYGVGELVRAALDSGSRTLFVALGGTATMDLGAGMAEALGVEFDGGARLMSGGRLAGVRRIGLDRLDPRLEAATIWVAADVANPLLGEEGAVRTYGPQKGATPAQMEELERGFSHLSGLIGDPGDRPGDGAAGGMAFLLRTLLGARVVNGAKLVMDATRFESRLEGVDLVFTGEGKLDGQTAHGKVVCAVGRAARARGVPVVALAGAVTDDARSLYAEGVDAWFSLCNGPMDEAVARANAASLLESAAENVVRLRFR